jgi:hypothetical protein
MERDMVYLRVWATVAQTRGGHTYRSGDEVKKFRSIPLPRTIAEQLLRHCASGWRMEITETTEDD